ncbi:unnamed protein product [Spirodela intermedia]|uniref:Auxin-responsive protein n=2 Tax=Spirodela intermedia TaxID=51605 RepID=A0A7I8IX07_SPIIN|nr:unnamed protein product [Spirodela intermedia]CAA6662311.1 unnamed protein product [Spirodela intermedia]CAA7398710.1 unnamed protein product [Spirodela intermedia]
MNGVYRHQDCVKRRWGGEEGEERRETLPQPAAPPSGGLLGFSRLDDAAASSAAAVVPPVTVVFEGSAICHRIHLHSLPNYESLALALRRLFVDSSGDDVPTPVALTNAVPGHIVAYEDLEDDLLLAGDLNWKDFVRVAKRIRILPAKASRRKLCGTWGVV